MFICGSTYTEPLPEDYSTEDEYQRAIEDYDYAVSDYIDEYEEEHR